ncbi:MAG: ThuA domain-containing protein, partial [Armatimonadetes bacterium]|nr:ThuA domain-containing protein [Armatimonadota bacterium]
MTIRFALTAAALLCAVSASSQVRGRKGEIRVLVVTGGHGFDRKGFDELWKSIEGIGVREVAHPDAHQWFAAERAREFDVMVFYDMHQDISEQARTDLVALLKKGKGLIVLHHALANYQSWDEAVRIAGGRFRLAESEKDGVKRPAS